MAVTGEVSTVSTRISAGTRPFALLRAPLASLLPALISFVGLTAVIVGILAMHVWMGGHGATTHHSAGTPTAGITTVSPANVHPGSAAMSSAVSSGHTHDPSVTQLLPALTQPAGDHTDQGVLIGCGEDCADEMALSMCVLALVLVGIAWLLTPTGRALTFSLLRRGPPVVRWASRPAPTPSLTQLCISRT
jgi:hypothetical protein